MFSRPYRQSKTKLVVLSNPERIENWTPLKQWLDKCKPNRLITDTPDTEMALALADRVKTRGLVIDCSNVRGKSLDSLMHESYGLTQAQTHILVQKCYGNVSAAVGLAEKCQLLGVKYSSEMFDFFDVPEIRVIHFTESLLQAKKMDAMLALRKVHYSNIPAIIDTLENQLDVLARLHNSLAGMKTVSEIASEVGISRAVVKRRSDLARKYDANAITRASFALANADRRFSAGHKDGVLEIMVSAW